MRRVFGILVALLAVGGLVVQSSSAHSSTKDVLEFDTMTGVTEPFTGTAQPPHPIRGVNGGGLPWELDRAKGELRSDGRLEIKVRGLVLARRAPVDPAVQGTNPVSRFGATVNCLTPASPDQGESIRTATVPASADGDARIKTTIALPKPCIAPIVFVTSPTGAWFATTGF